MAKFKFTGLLLDGIVQTARVGTTTTPLSTADVGKFVKLGGDSQYVLAAAGDPIEATFDTPDSPVGTYDGYALGAIRKGGRRRVTCQVSLAVGDYVVVGTVVAAGTALTGPVTVNKKTFPAAGALTQTDITFLWRVVSLDGDAGVGQTGVIECVSGAGTGTAAA